MELLGCNPGSWSPRGAVDTGLAEGGATNIIHDTPEQASRTCGDPAAPWSQSHQTPAKAWAGGFELLHHTKDCSGKVQISFSA